MVANDKNLYKEHLRYRLYSGMLSTTRLGETEVDQKTCLSRGVGQLIRKTGGVLFYPKGGFYLCGGKCLIRRKGIDAEENTVTQRKKGLLTTEVGRLCSCII